MSTPTPAPPYPLRPVREDEFTAYARMIAAGFGDDIRDDRIAIERSVAELDRTIAAFDGADIVGAAAAFTRSMTVPGGRELPVAAVTAVAVASTHRRRGILTAMMRHQLHGMHQVGAESVAALWASEASIYGRFGYGLSASMGSLQAESRDLGLRPELSPLGSCGRIRVSDLETALPAMKTVFEGRRRETPGWLTRPGAWWEYRFADDERDRNGQTAIRVAVQTDDGGTPLGYAAYRLKQDWADDEARSAVNVIELAAVDSAALAAMWQFLAGIDLHPRVRWGTGPVDQPLRHMVVNARAAKLTIRDNLWIRLVDVDRALAARRYTAPVDVVLDIADDFCPWNSGRFRLAGTPEGAECARTDAEPDLALRSADLAAAYLGGTTFATLAAAGRVSEYTSGTVSAISVAFRGDREPWCPEVF